MSRRTLTALLLSSLFGRARAAPAQPPAAAGPAHRIGIVLLHGIGADGQSMAPLAARLRDAGWRVRTPDLPYGGPRAFSQPVAAAERIVQDALDALRREGATRLVLAGFSLGGFFAAHMAGRLPVDALVAIAPNGGADMKPLDDQLAKARGLVAAGRGNEPTLLQDSDVVSPARYDLPQAVPSAYVSWFDPDGAMNWQAVWRRLRPGTPVLLVVPTRDLANLRKVRRELWQGLPPHPANRLYEPRADHLGAPMASAEEAVRWIRETVEAGSPR
ncbi:alpha/beta fold hydrolase [Ramlibacter tataouinensis]|uniref:alpha/beta fold hydrolase n=1 Tax=Ramlibacter tataouinensis TaxID=94132 RepID=UPI0022F399A7|nr:alpha/beta fold hydrolase [Ramlibacter tataouinensis]WBY01899.1 alpha/beta fold hydrolase [Ramlibacter tataouinensis]